MSTLTKDQRHRAERDVPTIAHVATVDVSLYFLLRNQLHAIREHGYRVVAISAPGPWAKKLVAEGFPHMAVDFSRKNFSPVRDLVAFWQLYRIFRRNAFAVVHTHNPKPGFYGQVAAKLAGTPRIVNTVHGYIFHERSPFLFRHIFIWVERIAAVCSTVILSQNKEDLLTALHNRICSAEKIAYIGNGIDVGRFDPDRFDEPFRMKKRRELGLDPGAFVVGFVGRLVREKGVLELFEAVRILKERNVPITLLIVGEEDKDKPDRIRRGDANAYGIENECRFLGFRLDMCELYAVMDVFVLPSHREGFPRSAMEACAMRVPCVASDIRGCREVVSHGENGLLVPPGDPMALSEAVGKIAADPEGAKRMGERGRAIALARFDETKLFRKVLDVYDTLLARGAEPRPPSRCRLDGPSKGHREKVPGDNSDL